MTLGELGRGRRADYFLCSRNAHDEAVLVRRPQSKSISPPFFGYGVGTECAASEGPRWTRAIGDPPINPFLSGEEGVCSRRI